MSNTRKYFIYAAAIVALLAIVTVNVVIAQDCNEMCRADFNRDGRINTFDLNTMRREFLRGDCSVVDEWRVVDTIRAHHSYRGDVMELHPESDSPYIGTRCPAPYSVYVYSNTLADVKNIDMNDWFFWKSSDGEIPSLPYQLERMEHDVTRWMVCQPVSGEEACPTATCRSDLDMDGRVNLRDFAIFRRHYGADTSECSYPSIPSRWHVEASYRTDVRHNYQIGDESSMGNPSKLRLGLTPHGEDEFIPSRMTQPGDDCPRPDNLYLYSVVHPDGARTLELAEAGVYNELNLCHPDCVGNRCR